MAQSFLDQLPKVPKGTPDVTECMICKEAYGTVPSDNGTIEHAVLLPCLHHVGSECIAIWLSPDQGLGNSCPLCRTVFNTRRPPNYEDEVSDEIDSEDSDSDDSDSNDEENPDNEDGNEADEGGDSDGEKDEENRDGDESDASSEEESSVDSSGSENQSERTSMTLLAAFQRVASCSAPNLAEDEIQNEDAEWFERWPLPTAEQIDNNEKRARMELQRPSLSIFSPQQNPTSQGPHFPPAADLEAKVAQLASAYRTMAFRETLLYTKLTEAGARMPLMRSPHTGEGLLAHQEEMLLWELGQRGAFSDARARPAFLGMTNRQSWNAHRAKGQVFTFEMQCLCGQGYWSTELGFGVGEGGG